MSSLSAGPLALGHPSLPALSVPGSQAFALRLESTASALRLLGFEPPALPGLPSWQMADYGGVSAADNRRSQCRISHAHTRPPMALFLRRTLPSAPTKSESPFSHDLQQIPTDITFEKRRLVYRVAGRQAAWQPGSQPPSADSVATLTPEPPAETQTQTSISNWN